MVKYLLKKLLGPALLGLEIGRWVDASLVFAILNNTKGTVGSKQAPFKCYIYTAINTYTSINSLRCFPFPIGRGLISHK